MAEQVSNGHDPQRELYAALADAVKACEWVVKRGDGQGYRYAKAEAVIAEADRVLEPVGVVVIPGTAVIHEVGKFRSKGEDKTLFVLRREFIVVHRGGGQIRGEMSVAIGANVGGTPPQATTSAATTALSYFLKDLLRMPRVDEEDVEHASNNRSEREEEPRPPARPQAPVPPARKATLVLRGIAAVRTRDDYAKAVDRWHEVLDARRDGDDRGYSDAEVEEVKAALAAARARVGGGP